MGARGPAPRPKLQILKEGNPTGMTLDHIDRQVELDPAAPDEPDWARWFPDLPHLDDEGVTAAALELHDDRQAEAELCRQAAAGEWERIVPELDGRGYIARVDLTVLADHCVTVARIEAAERDITLRGTWVMSERGAVRNPSISAANQYRAHLRHTMTHLYLTPVARARALAGVPTGDDGTNPFD